MPPATAELILEIVRGIQSDGVEMRAQIGELYTLVKGNGRPGLRQTQDELSAMVRACHEHRDEERKRRKEEQARADSWIMFALRPLWPAALAMLGGAMALWLRGVQMP
jgi:hypothetical protein